MRPSYFMSDELLTDNVTFCKEAARQTTKQPPADVSVPSLLRGGNIIVNHTELTLG